MTFRVSFSLFVLFGFATLADAQTAGRITGVQSKATTLVNLEGGYQITRRIRATVEVFNVFDAAVSDIDYYFTSRLRGETAEGVNDIHLHPAVPRTARAGLIVSF